MGGTSGIGTSFTLRHDQSVPGEPTDVERWAPGKIVLRREFLHGHLWTVIPTRVVVDTPEVLAVYLARGTPLGFPEWPLDVHEHPWNVAGHTHWSGHGKLMLHRPGDPYSVDLYWTGDDRAFSGFYVNLQEAFVRRESAFDTLDHELDLWWPVGDQWVWKDVEMLESRIADGRYSGELGERIRAAGIDAARLLDEGPHWFDTGWDAWTPPAEWQTPELPDGWDDP